MSRRKTPMAQIAQDYRDVFSTPEGERVLADLMTWCHAWSPIEETDPIRLAMATGEQNVAKRIAGLLAYRPEDYPATAKRQTDLINHLMEDHGPSN
ncbi:MAG: hypothetical protein AB1781_11210 [Pseudomonadota bacterium]